MNAVEKNFKQAGLFPVQLSTTNVDAHKAIEFLLKSPTQNVEGADLKQLATVPVVEDLVRHNVLAYHPGSSTISFQSRVAETFAREKYLPQYQKAKEAKRW